MNYYLVRYLIIFILIIASLIFFKINKYENNTKRIISIGIIVFCLFIYYIPFEIFMKFNTLKESFDYSFPNNKYIDSLETDNFGLVLSKDKKGRYIAYDFTKSKSKWNYRYPLSYSKSTKYENGITVDRYTYGLKNGTILIIYLNGDFSNLSIHDNYNNLFHKIDDDKNQEVYYCMINRYPDDYKLFVNDIMFEPY